MAFWSKHQPFESGVGINLRITSTVDLNVVTGPLQEVAFLVENDVLASRLLVLVMNDDYLHKLQFCSD